MGFAANFLKDLAQVLTNKDNATKLNLCCVGYFWLLAVSTSYACLFIAFPALYPKDEDYFRNLLYFFFLFTNMTGNLILGTMNPSTYVNGVLLPDPPRSWRLCMTCQQHCPPRSHHCPVCNQCILKRDHHCYFFQSCVGVKNLRYFLPYSLYVGLGAFFGIKQMCSYLTVTYIPISFSFYTIFSYSFPGILYNLLWSGYGSLNFSEIFCLLVLYGCCMTGFGSFFYFLFALLLVLQGQTAFEHGKGVVQYNYGIVRNFRTVFGNYGFLYFLVPLPLPTKEENAPWGFPKFIKGV